MCCVATNLILCQTNLDDFVKMFYWAHVITYASLQPFISV